LVRAQNISHLEAFANCHTIYALSLLDPSFTMDYAPFFTQTPQPFFGMAMAPTPSYSGDSNKIDPNVSHQSLPKEESQYLPHCGFV
jgi:hypothetical protein